MSAAHSLEYQYQLALRRRDEAASQLNQYADRAAAIILRLKGWHARSPTDQAPEFHRWPSMSGLARLFDLARQAQSEVARLYDELSPEARAKASKPDYQG